MKINFKLDVNKIRENLEKAVATRGTRRRVRGERIPSYLRKCKYCKYIELIYCKFHTVTIHPESRACPAFVLREEFSERREEEGGLI
ncbi:MAG: hypothetical protein GXO07_05190 [Crenarchaeota archaeon]|nr:hypothetical protein [Thermoproteota archaeon]